MIEKSTRPSLKDSSKSSTPADATEIEKVEKQAAKETGEIIEEERSETGRVRSPSGWRDECYDCVTFQPFSFN